MLKTKYPEVEKLVLELGDLIKSTLGTKIQGLYLFGSLTTDDFDPKTSDIDLLAIVESKITDAEFTKLRKMHQKFVTAHLEWNDRVEVAYVTVEGMKNFKTKNTSIVRISPGEPLNRRDIDIEWLIDWFVVQENGQTIFGKPSKTHIPHINQEEFIAWVKNNFFWWQRAVKDASHVGYLSYVILSLCRCLYALRFGKHVSKVKAGKWAIDNYPEWSKLINKAFDWHGSKNKSPNPKAQAITIRFVDFAVKEAKKFE